MAVIITICLYNQHNTSEDLCDVCYLQENQLHQHDLVDQVLLFVQGYHQSLRNQEHQLHPMKKMV